MKIRRLAYFLVVLLSGSVSSALAQEKNDSDQARVSETVMRYLDAWEKQDAVSMKATLHPQARVYQKLQKAQTGKNFISHISGERFVKNVARARPLQGKYNRNVRIVWVDMAGEVATAKVEILYPDAWLGTGKTSLLEPAPGVLDTHYVGLLKLGDGWTIVSDVYEVREAPPSRSAAAGQRK